MFITTNNSRVKTEECDEYDKIKNRLSSVNEKQQMPAKEISVNYYRFTTHATESRHSTKSEVSCDYFPAEVGTLLTTKI